MYLQGRKMECNYSRQSDSLPQDRCRDPNLCNNHGRYIWDESISTYHSGCDCDPDWEIIASVPRGKSIASSMRAPRIHSVQSMVFVTTYLEIIQRLESMTVSTTTAHVMEVSYDLKC